VHNFLANIKAIPKMCKSFQKAMLPLTNGSQSGQASMLSILNQGDETSAGYTKLLEQFLIPSAEQAKMIKRASRVYYQYVFPADTSY